MANDCASVVVKNTFIEGEDVDDAVVALHRTISDSCVVYGDGTQPQNAISRDTLMTMRKPSASQSNPMPRIAERPAQGSQNTYIDDFISPQDMSQRPEGEGPPGVFASSNMLASEASDDPRPQRTGSKGKVVHKRHSIMTADGFDDSWSLDSAAMTFGSTASRSGSKGKVVRPSIMTADGFDDSWPLDSAAMTFGSTPNNMTSDGFDDSMTPSDFLCSNDEDDKRRSSLTSLPTKMPSRPSLTRRVSKDSKISSNMVRVTEDSVLEDDGGSGPPGVFVDRKTSLLTNDGFDEPRQRSGSKEKLGAIGAAYRGSSIMTVDGFDDSWPLADSHKLLVESKSFDDEDDAQAAPEQKSSETEQVTQETLKERFPDRRKWSSIVSVGSDAADEGEEKKHASRAIPVTSGSNSGKRKNGRRNWGSVKSNDSADNMQNSYPSGHSRRDIPQKPVNAQNSVPRAPMPYSVPPVVPPHPMTQPMQFYDAWYHWGGSVPYAAHAAHTAPPYGMPANGMPASGMPTMDWMQPGHGQMSNAPQSQAPTSGKKKAGKGKRRKSLEGGATIVAGRHTRTTLMLKNLPNDYTRDHVVALLNKEGFKGLFNFVYMPVCLQSMVSFGYAFVNLVSFVVADQCWSRFQGFSKWDLDNSRKCEVCWSEVQQGLQGNVEHYRSSQIMHESVPELAKPAIYMNGAHVPFPPPTRRLSAPQLDKKHPTEML